jgi:hypothetical protein
MFPTPPIGRFISHHFFPSYTPCTISLTSIGGVEIISPFSPFLGRDFLPDALLTRVFNSLYGGNFIFSNTIRFLVPLMPP